MTQQFSLSEDLNTLLAELEKLPPFQNEACKKAFRPYHDQIKLISELKTTKKYKVVFIGTPGRGKTTAMCNWLGLLKKDKSDANLIDSVPLLSTSKGRTTVAEVRIRQTDRQSKFHLIYRSDEDQEAFIKSFCDTYFSEIFGSDEEYEGGEDYDGESPAHIVHSEIDRLILHMSGLMRIPSHRDPKFNEKIEKITQSISVYKTRQEFYQYVLKEIDLPHRNLSDVYYTNDVPFEKWVQSTFHELNFGDNDNCSIPKRIDLEINKNDLDLKLPPIIEEIVDTVGLDAHVVRGDLQDHLFDKNSICFIFDELLNPPSAAVSHILSSTFLSKDDKYCVQKTGIYISCSEKELGNVEGADGDPDKGEILKLNQIDLVVSKTNLPYIPSNTIFANALLAYREKKTRSYAKDKNGNKILNETTGRPMIETTVIIDYDSDLSEEYRIKMNNKVTEIAESYQNLLQQEFKSARDGICSLLQMEQEYQNKQLMEHLKKLKNKIQRLHDVAISSKPDDLVYCFRSGALDGIFWSTVRKINSLYGGYYRQWWTDLYTNIYQTGRKLASDYVAPKIIELKSVIKNESNPELKELVHSYLLKLDYLEKNIVENMGKAYEDLALNKIFAPRNYNNKFWISVQNESGKGYLQRVKNKYYMQFDAYSTELNAILSKEIDTLYSELLAVFP